MCLCVCILCSEIPDFFIIIFFLFIARSCVFLHWENIFKITRVEHEIDFSQRERERNSSGTLPESLFTSTLMILKKRRKFFLYGCEYNYSCSSLFTMKHFVHTAGKECFPLGFLLLVVSQMGFFFHAPCMLASNVTRKTITYILQENLRFSLFYLLLGQVMCVCV